MAISPLVSRSRAPDRARAHRSPAGPATRRQRRLLWMDRGAEEVRLHRPGDHGSVPLSSGWVPQGYADYVPGEGWLGRRLLPPKYGPPIGTELRVNAVLPGRSAATRTVSSVTIGYSSRRRAGILCGSAELRGVLLPIGRPAATWSWRRAAVSTAMSRACARICSWREDHGGETLIACVLEGPGVNPWAADGATDADGDAYNRFLPRRLRRRCRQRSRAVRARRLR
jgi:hypothetical protein